MGKIDRLLDKAEKHMNIVEESYHPRKKMDCDINKILEIVEVTNNLSEAHNLILSDDSVSSKTKNRFEGLFNRVTDAAVDIPKFCKCIRKGAESKENTKSYGICPECGVLKELEKSGFCKSCEASFEDEEAVRRHHDFGEEKRGVHYY